MMKKILLFVLLHLTLFAQSAQEFYDEKDYRSALNMIEKDYAGFTDIHKQLLWARCAKELDDEEDAMSAYERVLNLDEENIEAALFLATIYQKQNMKKESKALVEKLKKYTLSANDQNTLQALLSEKNERSTFRVNINAKAGYDSNVNANAGSGNLDAYYQDIGSNAVASEDVKESAFLSYGANLSYLYDMGAKNAWYLQADLNLYGQNYERAEQYDIYFAKVELGIGYKFDKASLYLPVAYDDLYYLENNLLHTLSITPTLNRVYNENYISTMQLIYKSRSYIREDLKNRDDNEFGLKFSLFKVYAQSYIFGSVLADYFKAKEVSTVKYINKNLYEFALGMNYHIGSGYFTKLSYQYRYTIFEDVLMNESEARLDHYNHVSLDFSKVFWKKYETALNYVHIANLSNYVPSHYDKDVVSLSLQYNY